jgi:hypothetical protein
MESKLVEAFVPINAPYNTYYTFFGGIVDDIHLMYEFISEFIATGGGYKNKYTFDDYASALYVIDNIYETMDATNDQLGIIATAQEIFC